MLTDKEKRYAGSLQRCRTGIEKTKGLIEYHRNMLKSLEKKEAALSGKLEKVKMQKLFQAISSGGYDIDTLRNAVSAGDFSEVIPVNARDSDIMPEPEQTQAGDIPPNKNYENTKENGLV